MGSRSARLLRLASFALLGLLAVAPAAAQVPRTGAPQFGVGLQFSVSLVVNLVFGAIVVAVAPDYLRAIISDVRNDPGRTAVFGLVALVGGFVALAALAITVVGLVVAVPGAVVFGLYVGVTSVISAVAVGYIVLDSVSDATLWSGLLVGALLSAAFNVIPLVGGLVNFVIGLFGLGAVSIRLYESYRG